MLQWTAAYHKWAIAASAVGQITLQSALAHLNTVCMVCLARHFVLRWHRFFTALRRWQHVQRNLERGNSGLA